MYNISAGGCFARVWGKQPHITYSECFDDCERGEWRDGVLCQDVERLTFGDSTFDLVISEDVFEHVSDYRRGFWEVRRVLKPGGYHVFSVPVGFTHPTLSRFEVSDGRQVPVLPVEHHGDPLRGQIAVCTSFGYDLLGYLEGLGFEARSELSRYEDECRHGTFDSCTFVTQRA